MVQHHVVLFIKIDVYFTDKITSLLFLHASNIYSNQRERTVISVSLEMTIPLVLDLVGTKSYSHNNQTYPTSLMNKWLFMKAVP